MSLSISRSSPFFAGLGDAAAFTHSQVPFRGSPVFLRLVTSMSRAADYAAGGFHVSVDRANGGGCKDDWKIHAGGTKAATCQLPLNREDVRGLWNTAAGKYLSAFNSSLNPETNLTVIKGFLTDANSAADAAFAAEGIDPPRDPQTGESQGAAGPKVSSRLGGFALATTGLASMLWFAFKHGDSGKGSGAGSLMGARRGRKRRRRSRRR